MATDSRTAEVEKHEVIYFIEKKRKKQDTCSNME